MTYGMRRGPMGANNWAQLLLFCVMPSLKAVCLLSIMYSVFKYAWVVTKLIHVFLLLMSVCVYVRAVVYWSAWLRGSVGHVYVVVAFALAGSLTRAIFSRVR